LPLCHIRQGRRRAAETKIADAQMLGNAAHVGGYVVPVLKIRDPGGVPGGAQVAFLVASLVASVASPVAAQVASLVASQVAFLVAAQVASQVASLVAAQVASQVAFLVAAQVASPVAASVAAQVASPVAASVAALVATQVAAQVAAQVAFLVAAQVASLVAAQVASQVAFLVASLVASLVAFLVAAQVASQVAFLVASLVASLVAFLVAAQVAFLVAAQVASLVASLVAAQVAAQVAFLVASLVAFLVAAQVAAPVASLVAASVAALVAASVFRDLCQIAAEKPPAKARTNGDGTKTMCFGGGSFAAAYRPTTASRQASRSSSVIAAVDIAFAIHRSRHSLKRARCSGVSSYFFAMLAFPLSMGLIDLGRRQPVARLVEGDLEPELLILWQEHLMRLGVLDELLENGEVRLGLGLGDHLIDGLRGVGFAGVVGVRVGFVGGVGACLRIERHVIGGRRRRLASRLKRGQFGGESLPRFRADLLPLRAQGIHVAGLRDRLQLGEGNAVVGLSFRRIAQRLHLERLAAALRRGQHHRAWHSSDVAHVADANAADLHPAHLTVGSR
jgi:hypothetical protein